MPLAPAEIWELGSSPEVVVEDGVEKARSPRYTQQLDRWRLVGWTEPEEQDESMTGHGRTYRRDSSVEPTSARLV